MEDDKDELITSIESRINNFTSEINEISLESEFRIMSLI